MAGAIVQSANGANSFVSSIAGSFSSTVTSGNAIIVYLYTDMTSVSISDSQGNSYILDLNGLNETAYLFCYHVLNVTGGSNFTITASFGSNTSFGSQLLAQEITGVSALDVFASSRGSSFSTPTQDLASVTTTNATDFIVSGIGTYNNTDTMSAGSGWSGFYTLSSSNSGLASAVESMNVTSKGSVTPTMGMAGTNVAYLSATWAFKTSSGGGTGGGTSSPTADFFAFM